MKTIRCAAVFLLAAVMNIGCNKGGAVTAPSTPAQAQSAPAAPAQGVVENGVQVVRVRVTDEGYDPASVQVTAGTPARFIFVQESKGPCAAQVHIPSMGVPKTALPYGKETTVEFMPKEGGSFTWMCGMDMMKGTILVKKG